MHETMAVAARARRRQARPSEGGGVWERRFPLLGLAPRGIFSAEFRQGEEGGDLNLNRVGRSSCSGGSFGKAGARCHSAAPAPCIDVRTHGRRNCIGAHASGNRTAIRRVSSLATGQLATRQQGSKPCQAHVRLSLHDLSSSTTTFFHHFFHHFAAARRSERRISDSRARPLFGLEFCLLALNRARGSSAGKGSPSLSLCLCRWAHQFIKSCLAGAFGAPYFSRSQTTFCSSSPVLPARCPVSS